MLTRTNPYGMASHACTQHAQPTKQFFFCNAHVRPHRRLMYSTVDESLTTALHQHYGGVARFALGLPWTNPGKGLHKLLEELRAAVDGCNTAQVWREAYNPGFAHVWAFLLWALPYVLLEGELANRYPCLWRVSFAALHAWLRIQMQSSIGAISSGPEVSHRLLHIVSNKETFEMQYLVFASKWVAEEFAKKAVRAELQVRRRSIACKLKGLQSVTRKQ